MKLFFIFSILIFTTLSLSTFAAIENFTENFIEKSIKIYRSPKSLFPSGEFNKIELEKNKIQEFYDYSLFVEKDNRQFLISTDMVAFDLLLSSFVISQKTKERYQVFDTKDFWVLGKKQNDENLVWLPMQDLISAPEDMGLALFLTSTPLKFNPSDKSETKFLAQPQSLWKILKWMDDWALIRNLKNPNTWGYARMDSLLLKYDFANFAMTSSKKWIPIKRRQGSVLISNDNEFIPIKNITALITNPNLAISIVTSENPNLFLKQTLQIKKWIADLWAVSTIKYHGEVFWRKFSSTTKINTPENLLTENLLNREIFSVSFNPKNDLHGLVSSSGIYLTQDNIHWQKISQFQNNNQPVLITDDGYLYVGDQRSSDNGKTFSPYFKWDQILSIIFTVHKSELRGLKITALENPIPGFIQLTLTAGTRKFHLTGKIKEMLQNEFQIDSIQSWTLSTNMNNFRNGK